MQSKGAIKLVAILLAIACLWQLSFTLVTNLQEKKAEKYAEAAALAAWYSSAPRGEKAEVDYTLKKEIKKPGLYKPGMVIYHTNYSMTVIPAPLPYQP